MGFPPFPTNRLFRALVYCTGSSILHKGSQALLLAGSVSRSMTPWAFPTLGAV